MRIAPRIVGVTAAASSAALALAAANLWGCAAPSDGPRAAATAAPSDGAPAAPAAAPARSRELPDPSTVEGPLGESIRRGQALVTRTAEELPDHVGNGLHCTSCHLDGGTRAGAAPWVGLVGVFPEYRARSGRVDALERRINDCFERSMNGTALDPESEDMAAILAYMSFISRGVPAGEVPGRGFRRIPSPPEPDRAHGAQLYAEKCATCHGEDGAGRSAPDGGYLFPALWGERSFNVGAGMARLDTAAAYVRWNMPFGQGGTLTDAEAYDVADYFIHQDRPDFARKDLDWPNGGKPRDARY